MKFICERLALQEALGAVSSVAMTRTPRPILECVRLTAEKDSLLLTAYDQELGIQYRVTQVDVSKPGETLVKCDRLMAIVRESSDETMTFETDDDILSIRGRDSHFRVNGQNVREFPPVPGMEGEANLTLRIGDLKFAIEKTLFAAARESTRYAINGVLWQKKGKQLRLVSTDGRRLAMSGAPIQSGTDADVNVIVPTKTLNLIQRLHFDADESVDIRVTANQIAIRSPKATISSVLVEGNFPRWEDVIPRDNDKTMSLNSSIFLSAVRRAALLSSPESKGVLLKAEKGMLELTSRSAEQGEANIKVEVDYKGPEIRIGFNPEFLVDALKVCDDELSIDLKDGTRPGLIKSGKEFQYVVMPVNLS
ncbi:MAG: DNA polymerase III subunit beta [Phycisphaerae bacterium]|nr:DNA polymerase III subunit beta [Phycisphaerae bacterium]